MQVHSVIGGIDYEGEDFASLKLFDCKSTAEMYAKDLENGDNKSGYNHGKTMYDYVQIQTQEIIMESLILQQLTAA
jgi:hypothetical protein